jgi:methylenetetrahydrofolate--tRNA-(uracil-5-)-methyltransferase
MSEKLIIIGGGLAGCEAAWQAAQRGIKVHIYEMRPEVQTGAHLGGNLAELVCSNSLGSELENRAPGLLKAELRTLGSLLLECAEQTRIPAGGALAVDRDRFSEMVTARICDHPNIQLVRQEMPVLPDRPVIVASGPLTSSNLSRELAQLLGQEHLYFFDAIAPIVTADSIDMNIAFRASRYDRGERPDGDYINCPMDRDQYHDFVTLLAQAERIQLKSIELELESGVTAGAHRFFEGCLPVEILARRETKALAFGPMRPVGLANPHNENKPYAIVQLRQDNQAGTLYNLVGFQTNLTFPEQRRVFRTIPGLEQAEFARYGQMHRNTFIFSPAYLDQTLQYRGRPDLFFAGQITGVEGYVGNIATGLLAGINAARYIQGKSLLTLPEMTMLGALCHYIANASAADFQPMKANFGLLPGLEEEVKGGKSARGEAYSKRATESLIQFLSKNEL